MLLAPLTGVVAESRCQAGAELAAAGLLQDLRIHNGRLYPDFSSSRLSYEIELDDIYEGSQLEPGTVTAAPHVELSMDLDFGRYDLESHPRPSLSLNDVAIDPKRTADAHMVALPAFAQLPRQTQDLRTFPGHALVVLEIAGAEARCWSHTYVMRVLRPPWHFRALWPRDATSPGVEEVTERSLAALSLGHGGSKTPERDLKAPKGSAIVLREACPVSLQIAGGTCLRTSGPFKHAPSTTGPAHKIGLWRTTQPHVFCLASKTDKDGRFNFVASRIAGEAEEEGRFGFGKGVQVGLRPELATDAIWPLQEGVESLGLSMQRGLSFRALALRTSVDENDHEDLPLVVFRPQPGWRVDVHLLNASHGKCEASTTSWGQLRFVCRVSSDFSPGDQEVEPLRLIAFCSGCHAPARGLRIEDCGRRTSEKTDFEGEVTVLESGLGREGAEVEPWAGWGAEVPEYDIVRKWMVRIIEPSEGGSAGPRPGTKTKDVIEVLLVASDTEVLTEIGLVQTQMLRLVGTFLWIGVRSVAVIFAVGAVVAWLWDLPARVVSWLPSASSALLSLQFLAAAGGIKEAPASLRALSGPITAMLPSPGAQTLVACAATIGVVFFMHGAKVCGYIVMNGNGSASALPHSLKFGGWELRLLTVLAFPLAVAAAQLTARGLVPIASAKDFEIIDTPISDVTSDRMLAVAAALMILVLLVIPFRVWRWVSEAMAEDRVIKVLMPQPGAGLAAKYVAIGNWYIFIDRVCDQLRAMPPDSRQMPQEPSFQEVLAHWFTSPSWCSSAHVAQISQIEHAGVAQHEVKRDQHQCTLWPQGPWRKRRSIVEDDEDGGENARNESSSQPGLSRLGSSGRLSQRSSSGRFLDRSLSSTSGIVSRPSVWAVKPDGYEDEGNTWQSAMAGESVWMPPSAMYIAHPIRATTKFAYRGSRNFGAAIAGVRCLPWVDCAVPTLALPKLERHLDQVCLRVNVGQLCGPLTSGGCAACFDWGTAWPWRWPAEVLVKVFMGVWLGSLQHLDDVGPPTLRPSFSLAAVALALASGVAVLRYGPYAHPVDNFSLGVSLLSVGVCAALRAFGRLLFFEAFFAVLAALLAAAPLSAALVAACVHLKLTLDGVIAGRAGDARFLEAIPGWGDETDLTERTGKAWWQCTSPSNAYDTLAPEDNPLHDTLPENHLATLLVQDMHPAPRLRAWVRPPMVHARLEPAGKSAGAVQTAAEKADVWLSLQPSLLFPPNAKARPNPGMERAVPIAVLVEPPDYGRLIFAEDSLNGGLSWQASVRDFFGPQNVAFTSEVERLILEHDSSSAEGVERPLVVIEVSPEAARVM